MSEKSMRIAQFVVTLFFLIMMAVIGVKGGAAWIDTGEPAYKTMGVEITPIVNQSGYTVYNAQPTVANFANFDFSEATSLTISWWYSSKRTETGWAGAYGQSLGQFEAKWLGYPSDYAQWDYDRWMEYITDKANIGDAKVVTAEIVFSTGGYLAPLYVAQDGDGDGLFDRIIKEDVDGSAKHILVSGVSLSSTAEIVEFYELNAGRAKRCADDRPIVVQENPPSMEFYTTVDDGQSVKYRLP